jgi:hypothetical protein
MSWFRRIQSYGLITLITLLIWLYAEGTNVDEFELNLVAQLPARVGQDRVVDFADGTERLPLKVRFRGNAARLSDLETRLDRMPRILLPLETDDLPDAGQGAILLEPLLEEAKIGPVPNGRTFSSLGVSVVGVEPREVPITADRIVEETVDVKFNPEGVQLGPSVTITPPEVPVTMTASLARLRQNSPDAFYVEARIPEQTLRTLEEGVGHTISARLERSPVLQAPHVEVPVQSVDVTFTIARQKDVVTLPVVPVWLYGPPSELGRYEVEMAEGEGLLRDVTIEAPRDLVDRIRRGGTVRVVARFELASEDLSRRTDTATISFIEIAELQEDTTRQVTVVPRVPSVAQTTFANSTITVTTPADPVVHFTVKPLSD